MSSIHVLDKMTLSYLKNSWVSYKTKRPPLQKIMKPINLNTLLIIVSLIGGSLPLIKVLGYIQNQPERDAAVVSELKVISKQIAESNANMDKRITLLENKVDRIESLKP